VSAAPQTRYARSPEGSIGYQVVGSGPIDLVFIPWWGTNVEIMWEEPSIARFLQRLASFSRLICFDKRGTGISDPVPLAALPTLEQWTDDVDTVMRAAGSERAALLGHAHGGQMALLFAATHPARTSALILADSCARQFGDSDQPWSFTVGDRSLSLDRVELSWGTGTNLELFAPSAAADERLRRWWARYERLSLTPAMVRAVVERDFENDLRAVLPSIRVPSLVLHRAGNRFIGVEHGRQLAAAIAGSRFVEIPGDDHLFHVGETDALLAEIEEFLTGVRPLPESDRVLATVLFTDIVDSTGHAARLGDRAWRALLDTHHQIARRELERWRGREVDLAGDGVLATFDGPARAVRCALALSDAARALGVEIRAGLHTGEIEVSGGGVRGIAVHIGARVSEQAAAGEVWVSSTVKDLVAGSGIRFEPRGIRALRGVPDQWRVYAARWRNA
jgi:pimeloyl-ACP methyl ester carboxylesterase